LKSGEEQNAEKVEGVRSGLLEGVMIRINIPEVIVIRLDANDPQPRNPLVRAKSPIGLSASELLSPIPSFPDIIPL
jgi:hypothetical protein